MKYLFKCILFFLISCISVQLKASHAMAIDVSYQYISPNKYYVCVNFYRDCSGISAPTSLSPVEFNSASCNQSFTMNFPMTAGPLHVSQLCPPQMPNANCSGGNLTGVEQYTYCDTVTLPAACADWVVSYDLCCRNTSLNLISPTSEDIYGETKINNLNGLENNSVIFTNLPVKYTCAGNNDCYNHGAVDIDGDSLVYKIINPKSTAGMPISFSPPFSINNPISSSTGMQLNTITGQMCFTPTTVGNWVITVEVEEWREINGVWTIVGVSTRDMQLVVEACNNTQPQIVSGAGGGLLQNLSGGATMPDSVTIKICPGDSLNFDIIFQDPTATTNLTVTSNMGLVCPGSIVTSSGTNPVTTNVSWVIPGGYTGQNVITFKVENDLCPVPGINYAAFNIYVMDGTAAGPDQVYCNGLDPVQLEVEGGSSFTWVPATGLSDPNIWNPIATPTQTTTYVVTSNLTSACSNTDTVVVTYAQSQSWGVGDNDTICAGSSTTITANGGNVYNWTPNYNINDPSIIAPSVSPDTSLFYTVVITDSTVGCLLTDSVFVKVSPMPEPSFTNSVVCERYPTDFVGSNLLGDSLIVSWQWDFGDGATYDSISYSHIYATPGNYNVNLTATDSFGCQNSVMATVNVLAAPLANFETSDNSYQYVINTPINFIDLSSGANQFYWNFDNGDMDSTNINPTYTYAVGGNYLVSLTIMGSNGCPNMIEKLVEVLTDPVLDLAMGFTPNSDGVNDVLYPLSLGFNPDNSENEFKFRVYNRWGKMLFESTEPNQGWDGTFNGVEQELGVYMYYMELKTVDGKYLIKKGDVTLIR